MVNINSAASLSKTRLHQNGYVTQKPDKQLKPDHKVSDEQPVLSAP